MSFYPGVCSEEYEGHANAVQCPRLSGQFVCERIVEGVSFQDHTDRHVGFKAERASSECGTQWRNPKAYPNKDVDLR